MAFRRSLRAALGCSCERLKALAGRRGVVVLLLILNVVPSAVGFALSRGTATAPILRLGWEGVVAQSSPNTCGPAVIATLAMWSGRSVGEPEVAEAANLLPDGLTLAEFARLNAEFGFHGSWFRLSGTEALDRVGYPSVAHLATFSGHFAILVGRVGSRVLLADPARGILLLSERAFAREWTGRIFAFDRARRH